MRGCGGGRVYQVSFTYCQVLVSLDDAASFIGFCCFLDIDRVRTQWCG